jgi:two-component system, sensor histidine kinase PdtaS
VRDCARLAPRPPLGQINTGLEREGKTQQAGASAHSRGLLERLPLKRGQPWLGYGVAALLVGIALLARLAMPIQSSFYFITFQPAVILTAFLFGPRPAVAALGASALLGIWFFIPPYHSLAIGPDAAIGVAFYLISAGLVVFLIHWMQAAHARLEDERRLSATLAENRELLFRELQHRVSNNLQVVAALLALQKKNMTDKQARVALDEASRRLGLIGRIHRQLYQPSGARIGMAAFLRELAADVVDSAGRPDVRLEVEADETLDLRSNAAIPVALIVAEAIANAVEHGFAEREAGTIRVHMRRGAGGGILVEVHDNGAGLPASFDAAGAQSLGLRIANLLAQQLGGSFAMSGEGGATARLTLPASAVA